ncbi:RAS guanyl-releasing protein 4 [Vombatus ursinus]|uniref:RAS guanyl-releasing protein 4 n=1 Tax=Vombatus ursinus TaxID=29139 RepID=UPI000FFD5CDF|nr:RAS guanyl-releasing protein 4 [Vombatus ursinus]XP_027711295.1 RAS guanyl-releasing protein 4 [Vombatus ursinus]
MNRKESKRKGHLECLGTAPNRGRARQGRRHMTCPSPREITKVMASMTLGPFSRGCSLDELLEKCIHSFDTAGGLCRGDHMLNMALTMHSWVLSSADFARRLLSMYQEAKGDRQEQRRLQICNLVRYWMGQYPEALHLEPHLDEIISNFWELVEQEGNAAPRCLETSTGSLSPPEGPLPPSNSPGLGKKRKVSLIFDHLQTGELAEHLTDLEFRAFRAITPQDLRGYVLHGSVRGCPALEGSVGLTNSVSRWVQVMVLSRPSPSQRGQVLDKFIHVAQRLRQLQNFNTLMAVTGGLCHSAISRLKDSHAQLSPDSTKTLLELTELLSSHNNYALYRRAWAGCSGFRLPILGVHLKDLVSLHQAMPDHLPDGQLHVAKLNSLYLRLQELRALQTQSPPGSASEDLLHLLTLSLDLFYTEDEIYELSYAREPRCPKTLPPSPFKAPLVVEWAPGVAPKPDRTTLSRHVEQLVESIFKNYDPEGRGTISQEDFERLSSSFPFACHGLHPPPRQGDGPFSQEELTAYLLRASAICAKLGLSFLHPFHEVTFKKPTFCGSCSGFLWGVTKQGYRCRDCGLCCHRHCKDRVEVECKKKVGAISPGLLPPQEVPSSTGSEESSPSPSPPGTQKRTHLRHAWTQTESPLDGSASDKAPTSVL